MLCDILITGSGSVSETTCRSLALLRPNESLNVTVLGRNAAWVQDLTALANAMSAELGHRTRFTADTIDWDAPDDLAGKLDRYQPRVVFHTASLQSPWELLGEVADTEWKRLVWAAGNAITLPMQAILAKQVATAVNEMDRAPLLVNVCFPDWVNAILHHLQLPICCGTGNVAMFTGFLKARFPAPEHAVQVVGHLYHYFKIMGRAHSSLEGPRVWVDGEEIADVEHTLAPCFQGLRSVNSRGKLINELVGVTSAEILLALLQPHPVRSHVPGPNGLPGGYPVVVGDGRVTLDLPAGITRDEAVALNQQGALDMGAAAIDATGYTAFSPTAQEALAPYTPDLAAGFHIDDLEAVCKELVVLRSRLTAKG
ncbi:hypothetical protein [Streptomyces sp. NPDC006285]|uniref:hypothetical protein n=1 Tax=Streptomyces sp. NPDC006285 TaxID=3364742 RepID=UPI00368CEC7F